MANNSILRIIPKKSWFIILLLLCVAFLFSYSVFLRSPWFGKLVVGDHHWLTGSTLKFAKIWYWEKPWNVGFAMIDNPDSVEFNSFADRGPYVSYMPGTIIPIYLLSLILHHEPTPSMVMGFNLFNHFLIAVALSLIVFTLGVRNGFAQGKSFLIALIPPFLELLLPGPFFWHQNIYFSDQAIILPFVAVIFLDLLTERERGWRKNFLFLAELSLIAYGITVDWFFVFIIAALTVKTVFIDKNISLKNKSMRVLCYWTPAIILIALFVIQLHSFGKLGVLWERFLLRTGVEVPATEGQRDFMKVFWLTHVKGAYGMMGVWFIWLSIFSFFPLAFIYKLKGPFIQILSTIAIIALAPFVQTHIFSNHSLVHNFSALKYSPLLAIVPFCLLPLSAYLIQKNEKGDLKKRVLLHLGLESLFIVTLLWYVYGQIPHDEFKLFFSGLVLVIPVFFAPFIGMIVPRFKHLLLIFFLCVTLVFYLKDTAKDKYAYFGEADPEIERLGAAIRVCTTFDDIIFSPDFEIRDNPPQAIALSMKRVYRSYRPADILEKIKTVDKPYRIVYLYKENPAFRKDYFLRSAASIRTCSSYYWGVGDKMKLIDYAKYNPSGQDEDSQ